MIRVMIVDDSGFMRLAIKKMLERHANIDVIAEASSAEEAVRLASQHNPDIITMDIEMPGGSGIDATKRIMKECPTAVIMVSSLTSFGAEATIQALNQGAVDFIPKASSFVSLDIAKIEKDLVRKIYYWAEHYRARKPASKSISGTTTLAQPNRKIKPSLIVIGASTGGPKVLPEIFSKVGKLDVPIVIALHMPEIYTESFANNMARTTGLNVVEGKDRMTIEPGMVVVAPGGRDTMIQSVSDNNVKIKVVPAMAKYTIHPSVNCLFLSAVECSQKVAGIILTGMGEDGLEGALAFKKYSMPMVAQDEKSCLVYGMPRAVVESGLATDILDISGIAQKINHWAGKKSTGLFAKGQS